MRRCRRWARAAGVLLTAAVILTAGSCRKPGHAPAGAKDTGIQKTFERGPAKVVLTLDRKEPTIADRLNLTLEVLTAEDYEAQLPKFGDKLEQFGIVDYRTSQPELVGKGQVRISRSYVLEPFLSGEYTIPPMKVVFWKKGEKETAPHEVETEPVTIAVRSLLPEKAADLKIRDNLPPVDLPRSRAGILWLAGAGVLVAAGAAAAAMAAGRKRRLRKEEEARLSPQDLAFREMEELIAEKLIEKGETKAFFQRISDIVRRYIERRFSIHAPEQTTEEFLESLRASEALDREYRPLLKAFLTNCDLVKFAEYQPTTEDIQKTFDSCKAFITGTGVREEGTP